MSRASAARRARLVNTRVVDAAAPLREAAFQYGRALAELVNAIYALPTPAGVSAKEQAEFLADVRAFAQELCTTVDQLGAVVYEHVRKGSS